MTILDVVDRLLPMVDIPKYKSFADRLVQRMTDVGVDIKQLSEGVGVTYEMARRYTLGSAKPRDDKMERVAEVVQSTPV